MVNKFFLVLLITAAINSGMGIIIPILPNLLVEYGFSVVGLSLPFVSLVVARIIIKPYTGQLLTKFTGRVLLIVSSMLYVGVFVVYSYVETKEVFIMLRFFEGLVEGVVGVVVTDMAIAYSNGRDNQGFLMGLFSSSFGLGFLLGPLIGSLVYDAYGIKQMFWAGAGIGIISLVASILLTHEEKKAPVTKYRGIFKVTWDARKYLGLYAPSILRRGLLFSFMIIVPLFSVDRLDLDKTDIGYLFVLSAIITTSLMPITGKLADRIDPRVITVMGLLLMGVSLIGISIVASYEHFLGLYVIETLSFAFMLPAATKIFASEVSSDPDRPIIIGAFTGLIEVITLGLAVVLPAVYSYNTGAPWVLLGMACLFSALPFIQRKNVPEEVVIAAEQNTNT